MRKGTGSSVKRSLLYTVMLIAMLYVVMLIKQAAGISVNAAIGVFVVLFLILVVLLGRLYERSPRRPLTWRKVLSQLATGLPSDQLNAYEEKLRERWEASERTLEVMVSLSHVYLHLNRLQDAERFAQQACAGEEAKGLVNHSDWEQRELRDNAYLVRADVRKLQGDFSTAARELDQYRKNYALRWNHVTTYTAFLYLLANDEEQTRAVTADIKPAKQTNMRLSLPEAYQFMTAYLQQRFLAMDTSSTLNKLNWQLGVWIAAYQSSADFEVYHARMREIVADMAAVVPLGWLQWANGRWSMNETEAMIAEMETKRAQGDTSYQTALVLASSLARLGYGEQAEPLARSAFDAIQAEGEFERRDSNARYLTETAHDAVSCALLMQGRFAEAADCLMQIVPRTASQNLFLVLAAWNYYLAGDMEQARTVINRMKPVKPNMKQGLPPHLVLLHHYLRYRLAMDESPEALINQAQHALSDWQKAIDRLVDNPYRRAIQAMVDDVHALVAARESQATAQTE